MADFTIDGVEYQSRKMNVFDQFHVLRALGPIIGQVGPQFITSPTGIDDLVAKLMPALDTLAGMEEEKVNYILFRCLAVVMKRQGNVYTPIFNAQAKRLMFEDLTMETLLQIMLQVLGENFAGFIPGAGRSLSDPTPDQENQSPSSAFQMGRTGL